MFLQAPHSLAPNPTSIAKQQRLVCGGSPFGCGLVERKAQLRGKQEGQQPKPVWISCLYITSVQSWIKSMGTICSSHKSLYMATRPTRLGEPPQVSLLLWSRGGLVIDHTMYLPTAMGLCEGHSYMKSLRNSPQLYPVIQCCSHLYIVVFFNVQLHLVFLSCGQLYIVVYDYTYSCSWIIITLYIYFSETVPFYCWWM